MYLVSACLLGVDCKYDGKNNKNQAVLDLLEKENYVLVCPEQLGGLSTPRLPSEIVECDGEILVLNKKLEDVTGEFKKGASETLKIAEIMGVKKAILKERSPSCGVCEIYDGSFEKKIIRGKGVTTRLLEANGIEVISDESLS